MSSVKDILNESFFIEMSLSNLDIYNEGIADLASKGIAAVINMINKFISWINRTVIPFLKRIARIIADLLKKTKLGKKIFGKIDERKNAKKRAEDDLKAEEERKKEEDEDRENEEVVARMKRNVLKNPTWLNYIAHSLINPNAVMKLANSTEDRNEDIQVLENRISNRIKDGQEIRTIVGLTLAQEEARKQLETMQKAVMTFESNSNAIIKKCEDLKRQFEGKNDKGSAIRAKNTSSVLQLITKKTAEAMKVSSENILQLQKVIDPFKK